MPMVFIRRNVLQASALSEQMPQEILSDVIYQLAGGFCAKQATPSPIFTQGWAESHHMLTCGCSHVVSSSVPALTQSNAGVAATSEYTGEPHFAQKCRNTGKPLPPVSL